LHPPGPYNMKETTILTIIALFFVTIASAIPFPSYNVWFGQYVGLLAIFFISLVLYLWNKNKPLSLFLSFCILSTFSVTRLSPRAIMLMYQISLGAVFVYAIAQLNYKNREKIKYAIALLVMLQFLWIILQWCGLDPLFVCVYNDKMDGLVGFSGAPNQIGAFFAITLPMMLHIHPLLSIISIIGLIVSRSSFAFVAGIVSGLLYCFFVYRKFFYYILIAFTLISAFFLKKVDNPCFVDFKTRFGVWAHAIHSTIEGDISMKHAGREGIVKTNPLYGYGLGNFFVIFPRTPERPYFNYEREKYNHAHNEYVESFFELGYIGIIIIFSMIIKFFINFLYTIKDEEIMAYFCCIMAILINSMGNFTLHIALNGLLLIVYYGLFEGVRIGNKTRLV